MSLLLLLQGTTDIDLTVTAGAFTLTGGVPTLDLSGDVDLTVTAGVFTITGGTPVLDGLDYAATVPAGLLTLTGGTPSLDLEGITYLPATAVAPRDLMSVALAAGLDWVNHSHVLRFYGAALDYDPTTDLYANDLNDELTTGGGYTAGGLSVTGRTLTQVGSHTRLLSDDVTVASATFSVAFVALIDDESGSDPTSPVLCVYDLNGLKTLVGEPFVVSPHDDGWGYGIAT